jgi:AcrR family transcriptional regulator
VTHSESANADRRVQRTRKLLQDALIELTIRKGFAAVTVRDITEHAGVNRATFYRHYQDKFDMFDQYAEEVYHLLEASDAAYAPEDHASAGAGSEELPAGLVKLFEHIRTHATFYRVMLGKHGDPGFSGRIQRYIQQRIRQRLPHALRAQPSVELFLSYVASGSVGALLWWLDHDLPYSPSEMAALSIRLSVADLGAVFGQDSLSQVGR